MFGNVTDPEISSKTKVLGIIGSPIEHSMSPVMHNAALQGLNLDYRYLAFHVPLERLSSAIDGIRGLGIVGVNVTIPHKENVMKLLDEIDEKAIKIGAVNTIKNVCGRLIGRNTDAEGAMEAIKNVGWKLDRSNVVIIGAGGAARAIAFALAREVPRIVILNIEENQARKLTTDLEAFTKTTIMHYLLDEERTQHEVLEADLLIHATSIGMHPNVEQSLVPKKCLHSDLHVFDIVYNPLETKLLKDAREAGCPTLGGIDMLVNQGALAFKWWTGVTPDKELMKQAAIKALGL
ncbi:MAG: shikimate dehydrogenase [Promethearchaeota archaeon CR_4]|nr:MAG: shikimate dehydrogenase [Candidatus Lokiarchaeota archaeon CR_4]